MRQYADTSQRVRFQCQQYTQLLKEIILHAVRKRSFFVDTQTKHSYSTASAYGHLACFRVRTTRIQPRLQTASVAQNEPARALAQVRNSRTATCS